MNNYQKAGSKIKFFLTIGLILLSTILFRFLMYYIYYISSFSSLHVIINTVLFFGSWIIFYVAVFKLRTFVNIFARGYIYTHQCLNTLDEVWKLSIVFIVPFMASLYNNPLFGDDITIFIVGVIAVLFSWSIFTVIVIAIKTIIYNGINLKDEIKYYI